MFVSGVTSDLSGSINGVSLVLNKDKAMQFDDSSYVFDFIELAGGGTLVVPFSDPIIGGFNQYDVVDDIGAIIPPNR